MLGSLDAERFAIVEESLRELLGVLADVSSGCGGVGNDAVVHIGQIYDVFELEAAQLEEATQNVLEDKSAVIADVGVVIDGRAATVHAHLAGFLRNEGFDFSRQSIVELDFGHRRSVLFRFDWRSNGLYLEEGQRRK